MACAGLLLVSVLAGGSTNLSDTVWPDLRLPPQNLTAPRLPSAPIDLSVAGRIHAPVISASGAGLEDTTSQPDRWENGPLPSVRFGPFRTQFGGMTGRHMHVATVRLEGVSILGGSIGGSLDSRSARITFSWPTSP